MAEITPQKVEVDELQEKITSALKANGNYTDAQRWNLLFVVIDDMRKDTKEILKWQERIRALEKSNIVMWIREHKAFTTTVLIPGFILLVMLFHEISPWVITHLEMIAGLPH